MRFCTIVATILSCFSGCRGSTRDSRSAPVNLTLAAVEMIQHIMRESLSDSENTVIGIGVADPGTPQRTFSIGFESKETDNPDNYVEYSSQGIWLRVLKRDCPYLQGVVIDVGEEEGQAGLLFREPTQPQQ